MHKIIPIKWRTRYKLCLVNIDDYESVSTTKWKYYNYGDFVGINTKLPKADRIKRLDEQIVGPYDKEKYKLIHLNKIGLDNRRENLKLVTHFEANAYKNGWCDLSIVLLKEYNSIIQASDYDLETVTSNTVPYLEEYPPLNLSISKPQQKTILIDNLVIDENLREYIYYTPKRGDKSDYFYLIGHPLVLEKLKKRRLQGTKAKHLTIKEKYECLIKFLEEINT